MNRVSRRDARAKEGLDVAGLMDMDLKSRSNGRDQGCLGHPLEEFEKLIGDLKDILAFLVGLLKKLIDGGVDGAHQPLDPLILVMGSNGQEPLPVDWMLGGLALGKEACMPGNGLLFDHNLQMFGKGPDQTGLVAVGRGDGVAVMIEGDKTGFTDRGRQLTVRGVSDPGKRLEFLLF